MPASKAIELITKKLDSFGLDFDRDIVASVTDGACLMKKIGYDSKPEHQMCYNHAIHLCVIDVLFKKNNATLPNHNFVNEDGNTIEAVNHDDDNDNEEEDENPIKYVQNIQVSTEGLVPSLITEFQEPVAKIRKLVQMFHRSPVRNDVDLQPNIVKTFGKEIVLICDSRTRWSSRIAMLDEANTPISQLVKQQFEKRIFERRNINLIHLMKYLLNPDVLNPDD